jgi:hypothetical protein
MNRTQMLDLLDKGYTPEYISLLKWLELRRQVMDGKDIKEHEIRDDTCGLCKHNDGHCSCCSLGKHFGYCENNGSIWNQIYCYTEIEPIPLHLITQMVNQLQFLVAVYGKYVTNRDKP